MQSNMFKKANRTIVFMNMIKVRSAFIVIAVDSYNLLCGLLILCTIIRHVIWLNTFVRDCLIIIYIQHREKLFSFCRDINKCTRCLSLDCGCYMPACSFLCTSLILLGKDFCTRTHQCYLMT